MDNSEYYTFDDERNEVVFHRHDMPTPWMNYLSNGTFTTMISHAGGGLSWYKSPEIWRIGRYNFYNLPTDGGGLFVYICDRESGKVWNPSFIPCEESPDKWESAHSVGYTRFHAEKDGVRAQLYCFVGKDNTLVYKMCLSCNKDKKLDVFACCEMGLMEYLREVQWQCYCKNSINILYEKSCDALVYEYFIDEQARPDETPKVFFTSNRKIKSFDCDRTCFLGNYRGLRNPVAIEHGYCANSELRGGEGVFAIQTEVNLIGGKIENVNFFLGTVEPNEVVSRVVSKYKNDEYTEELFERNMKYWKERLSVFSIKLSDKNTQRMVNTFNPLQAYVNFLVCREISFYATGTVRGIGVRDASQDILAI